MKALLINPIDKTIEEVEYDGDYKQIYKYIDASPFGVVDIPNDDTIYIDDEGLYKDNQHFFIHKDVPTPLGGKALVLGADHDTGDSTSVHATRKELKHRITFIGEQRVDHSKLGFTIETIN
jgi:hypothetical protein